MSICFTCRSSLQGSISASTCALLILKYAHQHHGDVTKRQEEKELPNKSFYPVLYMVTFKTKAHLIARTGSPLECSGCAVAWPYQASRVLWQQRLVRAK
eukprot:5086517-Pleurochrysis_carterae.AAC.2